MIKIRFTGSLIGSVIFIVTSCGQTHKNPLTKESTVQVAEKPNLIFYLSDDQDVYDYGCYGNEKVKTPAVDQLASEGILFSNAFTGQAICAPSRSQLLTGKYPLKNGCFANHTRTRPNIVSITKYMRDLGYEVIRAGKSHIAPERVYDWDVAWDNVEKSTGPRKYVPTDSIEAYFKKNKKPFFMLIASAYPHAEYYDVPEVDARDIQLFPFNKDQSNNQKFLKSKAGYYRSIAEDNAQLTTVLDLVDTYLDKENTLFIYSADHGVSGKFTVKDVGLKVPFVARWPKVIAPNTTTEQLIHYTDVLPTFIKIAGGEVPEDMDGKSFLPLLKGENVEINPYVYGVRTNQNILKSEVFPSRMIRDKRFKYIRNFNAMEVVEKNLGNNPNINVFIRRGALAFKEEPFEELYDLENDPYELHNLATDTYYAVIKDRLTEDMFKWMQDQGDFLNEETGTMPLISPPGNRGFKLDQDTPRRTIPDSLKNTLNKEDYLIIEHW